MRQPRISPSAMGRRPKLQLLHQRLSWSQRVTLLIWAALGCTHQPPAEVSALEATEAKAPRAPSGAATTSLSAPACVTMEVQTEGGNSTQRCPGVSGYELLVVDSDSRMTITVVDPKGHVWPLSYDQVIAAPQQPCLPVL